MSERPVPDLDAEREIDLRSAWHRIVRRWWLPVAGLVAGGVLGVLLSVGGGKVFEAKTLLYLGQPFTPNGGGQIQSLATNPKTVSEIVRSESVLEEAATCQRPDGGTVARQDRDARDHVAGTDRARLSPLVEITVQANSAAKAERAAASLTAAVLARRVDVRPAKDLAAAAADRR